VDFTRDLLTHRGILGTAHHTDNLDIAFGPTAKTEAPADGAFVTEISIDENVVHHSHAIGADAIAPGEFAACQDRDSQGLEVAETHRVETRAHVLVIFRLVAFNGDGHPFVIARDDTHLADGRGFHAGSGGHTFPYFLGEAADALGTVAPERWIHGEAEETIAAESQVDALQIVQRSREQSGGNQHQKRKGHLGDYQRLT